MKLTFECPDKLYKYLCDTEEYFRNTPDLRNEKCESLDQAICALIGLGFSYLAQCEPAYIVYTLRLEGIEPEKDDDGNVTWSYPEKPDKP
jgi:hypothetical protein